MKQVRTSFALFGLVTGLLGGCAGYQLPGADVSSTPGFQNKDGVAETFQGAGYQSAEAEGAGRAIAPAERSADRFIDPLIKANYQTAEQLVETSQLPVEKHRNLVIATFVNIDNLEQSSALGRMMAEQIASRLTQLGYQVVELKLRKSIFIKKGDGEFMLSRDLRQIGSRHNAQAVIAGTYAASQDRVYVNARLIDIADGTVTASHDYAVPMTRTTFGLVTGCMKDGQWICRMP